MPVEFAMPTISEVFQNEKQPFELREITKANSFEKQIESIPELLRIKIFEVMQLTGEQKILNCSTIKTGRHRSVYRIQTGSNAFFLKHFKTPNWKSTLRNQILGSQAEREYRSIKKAKSFGLIVPKVLGFGSFPAKENTKESFLLTQEVPDSSSLFDLLNSKTLRTIRQKKSVIRALAQVISRMMDANVRHRDFHAGNVLVNLNNIDAPVITLIDLQSFRIQRGFKKNATRLLGTLYHSVALSTSRSERLRFLKSLAVRIGIQPAVVRSWCIETSASIMNYRSALLKKQDRRWKRGNRRLRIRKDNEVESRCIAELKHEFLDEVSRNPEKLFADENVERWFKKSKSGKVASLKIPVSDQSPLKAYYKEVQPSKDLRHLIPGLRKSPVRNAWENGHAFLRRDIPTPKPLLFRSPVSSSEKSEYLLSETVPNSIVLSAYYEAYLDEMQSEKCDSWLNKYADASAKLIRKMHDAGYDHRDLKSNNVLVSENWNETKLWFLDLDSVRRWRYLPSFRRQQNIARFCRSSFDSRRIRSTHRLRFLKSYLDHDYKRHWKAYWRAIEDRIQRKKRQHQKSFIMNLFGIICLTLLMSVLPGCSMNKNVAVGLPSQHSINSDQLVILSDFKLPKDHKLIKELAKLRKDVSSILKLDLKERDVVVYLFSDSKKYQAYLDATYPGLPIRRAYFVGTPRELSVYAVWGDRIQEDLRHEYTHGLLHAGLKTVPLWLDEGLAEYFEVAGDSPGGLNASSIKRLTQAYKNGWKPDMNRLELLETVGEMQRMDYQEAWAWVHFMLNENENTKQVLLSYLQDLNSGRTPTPLSDRLRLVLPDKDSRFVSYLSKLQSDVRTVGFARLRNHFQ